MVNRFAVGVSYDGAQFAGWQVQPGVSTVQGVCQEICKQVVNHDVVWFAAGRTDAGVHASEMVAHFDVMSVRTPEQLYRGMNSLLPKSVRVLWVKRVADNFHARHSALSRSYTYVVDLSVQQRPYACAWSHWLKRPIDRTLMAKASQLFIGEHDFSRFRAAGCQSTHALREIHSFELAQSNDFLYLNVTANAFVYRMVRKIVGTLFMIGHGSADPTVISAMLLQKCDTVAPTAPACGLHFMHASYNPHLSKKVKFGG